MRDRFHEYQSVGLTSSKEFTRMIVYECCAKRNKFTFDVSTLISPYI